jgi:hypothetical protein
MSLILADSHFSTTENSSRMSLNIKQGNQKLNEFPAQCQQTQLQSTCCELQLLQKVCPPSLSAKQGHQESLGLMHWLKW